MLNIRFGIVGCGAIGPIHADAIKGVEGAALAAVCDLVPERAKKLGEKHGVRAFTKVSAMLDHVDAVTLGIPSGHHALIGEKCALAGKHIVCEKPIDVSLRNAEKLVHACRSNKRTLTVISQHRFANDVIRLRDAAQNGEFGKLLMGDAYTKWYRTQAYYDSGDWRGTWKLDGGGCLMNQGVHYVDMIQWIMGGVRSVQAIMRTGAHDIEVEDHVYALVEYRNGAIGVIHGSTATYPGFAERLEVHGQFGSGIIEGDRIKTWQVDPEAPSDPSPYGKGVQSQPTPNLHVKDEKKDESTGAADPSAIWGEQHRLQIEDFVRAIKDNRDPAITGEAAIEPVKVILAIYKSARAGGKRIEVA